jgi:predicted nucleic acid-binding protein
MEKIFIDAGPFYALNTPHDQYHDQAQAVIQTISKQEFRLVTTDYVIDEALTMLITSRKAGYHFALNLLKFLSGKGKNRPAVHTEFISQDRFHQSIEVFRRYNRDKTWSFTDCTSFAVMKELKIKTAFTFDDHFDQMGFKILG